MGKGDKKTRRGKISIKSFGVTRARKKKVVIKSKPEVEQPVVQAVPKETKKPAVKKETKAKKPEKTEDIKKKE